MLGDFLFQLLTILTFFLSVNTNDEGYFLYIANATFKNAMLMNNMLFCNR